MVRAVVVDSALRRRYPVSCALQVGNGVLPRLRARAFLARSLRRPPGEDGRLELLPSRHWATPIFPADPANQTYSARRREPSRANLGSGSDVCGGFSASRAEGRSRLAFAPYGRQPRLLVARKSRRAVVVSHLEEPGSFNVIAPGVEIEEATIAAIAKAFLVVSSWV